LPFLILCFLFLLLCVLCLVFAYLSKDNGSKDTAIQSSLSGTSLLLDFTQLQTQQTVGASNTNSASPMYIKMSDQNYFFTATPNPERTLFDAVFATGTAGCYEAEWYLSAGSNSQQNAPTPAQNLQLSLKTTLRGQNSADTNLCASMGSSSIVLLPHAKVVMHLPMSVDSLINTGDAAKGVTIT